jgi:Protein of unknown function (DUF1501)
MHRRHFLHASLGSGLAAFGGSLLHSSPAHAGEPARPAGNGAEPIAKHVIVLWMNGGPSHIDSWDPKIGATASQHKAIKTRIPGALVCEPLGKLAERADKLAIVRSMTYKEGNHDRAQYLMRTGYSPNPTVVHPSLGAWLSQRYPSASGLPSNIAVGGASRSAGFLGVSHAPFVIPKGGQLPDNIGLGPDIDKNRFDRRAELLAKLDAAFLRETQDGKVAGRSDVYTRAKALMTTPDLAALDLSGESDATKASFGDTEFGRGCLTAVRLVEAGVRFVEVTLDGWDMHEDIFTRSGKLLSVVDNGMSALLDELGKRSAKGYAKSILDSTLVIWMGDFGRTPKINAREGRDHFPNASSVVLAGAGIRKGQVYGATDAQGDKIASSPVKVPDLMATVCSLTGLPYGEMVPTPSGRPIGVTDHGAPVAGLLA